MNDWKTDLCERLRVENHLVDAWWSAKNGMLTFEFYGIDTRHAYAFDEQNMELKVCERMEVEERCQQIARSLGRHVRAPT